MAHLIKALIRTGVLLSLLWVTACSSQAPTSTPTPDLDPLRTEVAATVWAEVTQAILLTPSITPLPSPTATPLPTATPAQSATPTASATAALITGTPGAGTVNQARWVSQSVEDGTIFAPGESFSMTWTIRNAGTSTWTTGYMLRFFSGNAFGAPNENLIGQDVLPGGTIDITLQMTAPATPGDYRSDWVMATDSRGNFNEGVFLKISVVTPATATTTSTPAPTPTP